MYIKLVKGFPSFLMQKLCAWKLAAFAVGILIKAWLLSFRIWDKVLASKIYLSPHPLETWLWSVPRRLFCCCLFIVCFCSHWLWFLCVGFLFVVLFLVSFL